MSRSSICVLVFALGATAGIAACSSHTTPADGGTGAGGGGNSGSGGSAGASGAGGQADAGVCRTQLQTCSDTQRCCAPLICAGNCTMPVNQQDASSGDAGVGGHDAGQMSGPTCPSAPPAAGTGCTGTGNCYYQDCAHAGRTIASCSGGSWSVQTAACGNFACFPGSGRTCTGDQVCSESAGGALLVECVNNTCGTGPISCSCLSFCSGSCAISGSAQGGFQVTCNTCPTNQCA